MSGSEDSTRRSGVSRRQAVAGTVVGGLGLAAIPGEAEATSTSVGSGRRGEATVEFRGRIDQTGAAGQQFTSYGFLTRAHHTRRSDLFSGSPHDVSTALLTAYAVGDLSARVLDMSVHSLDIVGTLTVYQRAHPGADFTDPDSFKVGKAVARYDLRLQDILAVYAEAKGIPTLTGDMHQTAAKALGGPLEGKVFGRRGNRMRMFATGLGTLVDPVTLNAQLEIAGNWSVE